MTGVIEIVLIADVGGGCVPYRPHSGAGVHLRTAKDDSSGTSLPDDPSSAADEPVTGDRHED